MRYLIQLLFLQFLIVSSCSLETPINETPFEKPNEIIFSGKIENYDPDVDEFFIKFGYNDLTDNQKTKDVIINKDGSFIYSIKSFFPSEYFFIYKNLIPFYAFPGDSIHFVFNNDSIEADKNIPYSAMNHVTFSGRFNQMTEDYYEYMKYYYFEIYDWEKEYLMPQQLDSAEYLNYVTNTRTKYYKSKVDSFLLSNVSSLFFKEWINFEIKFMAYDDLIRYQIRHKGLSSYSYKDNFLPKNFEFILNKDEINKPNAIFNKYFRSFVKLSEKYIVDHNLPLDSLKKLMELYKTDRVLLFNTQKKMIIQTSEGFGRDLLLANFYSQFFEWKDLESFEYFKDSLDIENPFIKNYILNQYKSLVDYSNQSAPPNANVYHSTDNSLIFDSIISLYPNKVLYIDFWAPWCGPCMGGIEDSKKLKRDKLNSDIVFIYLGYKCSKSSWITTINEKSIQGEHYHLSNNQCSELSNRFKITGIPRYLIVNKEGKIVNDDAPAPIFIEELNEIFNYLIKE